MAEIIDVDGEEIGEIEAVENQLEPKVEPEQKQELPEKYRGKTVEQLAKMHEEAEKLMSRQAQEVGEVRKLADELLKSQIQQKPAEVRKEVDFFENPQEAIRQAVESNPRVLAAEQMAAQIARAQTKQAFEVKHPDAKSIVQEAEFANWVKSSPIRVQLYQMADSYNLDAADELISTYKQLKSVKQEREVTVDKHARENALQAASVDVGGSGESGKKVYRRSDLIRLKMRDPAKYEAMQDEIMAAYAEDRIK